MAGAAVWKGYISLGGISVPVKLHTAVREDRIQFHLLHRKDRVRLRQQMVCAYEKIAVPPEAQVKGFEVEEGRYIIVGPEEIEETAPEKSRLIEVHEFVGARQIDPVYFERAYYLEPDMQLKGYNALAAALKETEAQGICTWSMRKRSYLGALRSSGNMLGLYTLRYADEVVPVKSLELEEMKSALSEKELRIGGELVKQLTARFDPRKFENEHQNRLRSLIEKKSRGEKVAVLLPRRLKPTKPDKLIEALEASLRVA